jgi:hypothetical protein
MEVYAGLTKKIGMNYISIFISLKNSNTIRD